ncbi:MAG: ATP-dependent DNA helicase, partial [Gammaproteobacteria bacterium]|nr:ATP-dependent DNA helicase [Gammaproteobacteria bacterium]
LAAALSGAGEETGVGALGNRTRELAASLERIAAVGELEGARSIEITPFTGELPLEQSGIRAKRFALSLLPFDIAARFQALIEAHPCSWVFTSATLSLGEDFSPFTGRLGLDGCATLKIDSPFDYPRQSLLYLPAQMPLPASPQFLPAVMEVARELIEASRGGAFVLFTSHRALAAAASLWRGQVAGNAGYRLLVQGEGPRERLLREFREDGSAVLLGTTSFWEGVDVKGSALRLVVIEKLPFASPDDPLVRARVEHLEATGRSAFREYQLPEAALALKQGVGRLIRSEEDFGAVAICDPRLTARGYGKVFLAALPPMSVTRERQAALDFLSRHGPPAAPLPRGALLP